MGGLVTFLEWKTPINRLNSLQIPSRLFQARSGSAAKGRGNAKCVTEEDSAGGVSTLAEAQSGAPVVHDGLVPMRNDADTALGYAASCVGLFPL